MSNKVKQEMDQIEIPKELSERSKMGIAQAKDEMRKERKSLPMKWIGIAAALAVTIGGYMLWSNGMGSNETADGPNQVVVTEDGGVVIPAIELPDNTESADMIGLIVYNGKIYTQTATEITPEAAKALVGEKLGTTKGTIDEWSEQEAYEEEFASTVGVAEVYSVKGYDKDFRIMTYAESGGEIHAEFFENMNGFTVYSGADVFGKLNLTGNISEAQYRTYSDWNNSVEQFYSIEDMELVNSFVEEMNNAKPLPRTQNSDPIGTSRTDEQFKEFSLYLKDGSVVRLILLKEGYIYYGFMPVYFEMSEDVFNKVWSQIE